ncbi:preprotein translocase subunit YajC [Sphingomonas sabuli]|uniref:Sec translocon accessory complex subunit YajC n=1 Tax=Sphingomonas sabuli TaxID=2764186 RepID=A0A7G9L5G8_9SPHN|nr:preprotein translocase subunit YajC [Sphingomonas sabuli]QNM83867.1 preprotein translocase subunit YajC [Sphingomonas sabuli]
MLSYLTFTASAAAAQPGGAPAFLIGILPWLLIFVIFYVLLIRPQQKRAKEHQAEIAAAKKGDEVITGGGLRGRVTKVTDTDIEVEIAQGVRVRAVKSTISAVVKPNAKPAND